MSLVRPLLLSCALTLAATAACSDDNTGTVDVKADSSDTTDTTATTQVTDTSSGPDLADSGGTGCNPVAQTGCADNQNCTFVANETEPTCQAEGPVAAEQSCSSENRCERGVCLNLNQTESLCYAFCAVDADCPGSAAGSCLTLTNASFKICKIAGIYDNCDLLTQNCEDETKSCYAVANEDQPICLTTGTKALAAACDRASDCVEGLACVNDVCRTICDPTVADVCGETFVCNAFFANAGYCEPK